MNHESYEMNENSKGLVPKFRFPEFRDSEEWKKMPLSELLTETKHRNRDLKYSREQVLSVSGEYGCVNQIEYLGRSYAGVSVKDYHVVETGDIVYTKSPLRKNPFGIIKENKGKPGIVSTLYAVYRVTDKGNSTYLDHYFSNDYNLNSYLQPIVRKGAKNDMKVNNFAVLGGKIFAPKPTEQQKIADCLTFLAELITAENGKLEAYKIHKTGLMQKLCPVEGETVPEWRFPEFRGKGEWITTTLSSLAKRRTERNTKNIIKRVLTNSAVNGVVDQRDFFEKDIANQNNLDNYFIVDFGDYVYNPRISKNAPVGPISKNKVAKGIMSPLYTVFEFIDFKNDFFEQYFQTNCWHKYLFQISNTGARHDRMSVTPNTFMKMPLTYPELPEQQKIADCLTSLDELINAQSRKIEALKIHKKGLMQGLFPSVEGVDV